MVLAPTSNLPNPLASNPAIQPMGKTGSPCKHRHTHTQKQLHKDKVNRFDPWAEALKLQLHMYAWTE